MAGLPEVTTAVGSDNYGVVTNYTWSIKVTQIDCGYDNPIQGNYLITAKYFIVGHCLLALPRSG